MIQQSTNRVGTSIFWLLPVHVQLFVAAVVGRASSLPLIGVGAAKQNGKLIGNKAKQLMLDLYLKMTARQMTKRRCFDSYCSSYCSSPIPLWRTCCLWALQFCLTKGQRILIFIQDGSLLNLMWHAQNRSDQESLAVFAVDCFRATGLVLFLKMEGSFEPAGHDEFGYQPGITFRQTSCRECLWKWGMEPQNCDYPLVP